MGVSGVSVIALIYLVVLLTLFFADCVTPVIDGNDVEYECHPLSLCALIKL